VEEVVAQGHHLGGGGVEGGREAEVEIEEAFLSACESGCLPKSAFNKVCV
jgi:hypothetical protein